MRSEWNNFKRINKTRKKHICMVTSEVIPEGSSCWSYVGEWEGEFQSWYCCDKAKEFMDKNTYTNGWDCQDIGEEMREKAI